MNLQPLCIQWTEGRYEPTAFVKTSFRLAFVLSQASKQFAYRIDRCTRIDHDTAMWAIVGADDTEKHVFTVATSPNDHR